MWRDASTKEAVPRVQGNTRRRVRRWEIAHGDLAAVRPAVRGVRRTDVHIREGRHTRRRLQPGDGRTHGRGPGHGVADGAGGRLLGHRRRHRRGDADIPCPFRAGDGRVLALLLQGDPAGRREQGRAYRQEQHRPHHAPGVRVLRGVLLRAGRRRDGADVRWHHDDDREEGRARQRSGPRLLARLRGALRGVRGADVDPREGRHRGRRIQPRHGYPHRRRPGHGLGHRVHAGHATAGTLDRQEGRRVPGALRSGYRRLLALLLQGSPGRPCVDSRACGQAQHPVHGGLRVPVPP